MTYTQLEDIGDVGLRELLNFPSLNTPIYYPVMLFVIFMVFTMATYFREIGREGKGNILSSLAIGGFVTTVIAFILSLLGLVQTATVVTTIVISLIFEVIFLVTGKNK